MGTKFTVILWGWKRRQQ